MIVIEFVPGVQVSHTVKELKQFEDITAEEEENKIALFKDRVVDAICFSLSLQPPRETSPGPVGGGLIAHFIFGRDDPDAPREFDDLEDLQNYVDEENKKSGGDISGPSMGDPEDLACIPLEEPTDNVGKQTKPELPQANFRGPQTLLLRP